jgi:hypothetical protein
MGMGDPLLPQRHRDWWRELDDVGFQYLLYILHCILFFEVNQAEELPIILKRRDNAQTGHNNK